MNPCDKTHEICMVTLKTQLQLVYVVLKLHCLILCKPKLHHTKSKLFLEFLHIN
jgi:hypothetical protein